MMETFHTAGLMLLMFWVMPQLDVTRAVLLMTGVGLVPSLLRLTVKQHGALYFFDGAALLIQLSAAIFYPVFTAVNPVENSPSCPVGGWGSSKGIGEIESQFWPAPLALLLISASHWENFIDHSNNLGNVGTKMWNLKKTIHNTRAKTMAIVYLWKLALTFALIFPTFVLKYPSEKANEMFNSENFLMPSSCSQGARNFNYDWLILFGVQAGVSLVAYLVAGLSVMAAVQQETYSLAITIATPATLGILQWVCTDCSGNIWDFPTYTYWNCYSGWGNWKTVADERWSYFGFLWWLSQLWITRHLWMPQIERLARTDR